MRSIGPVPAGNGGGSWAAHLLRSSVLALAAAVALSSACAERSGGGRPEVGAQVPAYRAATLEGDTVALSDFRGRPVLVNLWATWCAPCRRETPYLQSVSERFADQGLEVVGVSVDNRTARGSIREFMEEYGVTYTILHDPAGRALDTFSAIGLPVTLLVDGDGIVRFLQLGPIPEGYPRFESALEEVVGSGAP